MRASTSLLTAILCAASLATATLARAEEPACYDAQVSAVVARHVPTDAPWCEGCHIMAWPWILDLQIERVLKGRAPDELVTTVLTIEHYRRRLSASPTRFWLRRNTLGLFNAVRHEEGETFPLCPPDSPPEESYVRLPADISWKEFRRDAELAARESPWR